MLIFPNKNIGSGILDFKSTRICHPLDVPSYLVHYLSLGPPSQEKQQSPGGPGLGRLTAGLQTPSCPPPASSLFAVYHLLPTSSYTVS